MPRYEHHFTLAEARSLLPKLRAAFKTIHRLRKRLEQADAQLGQRLLATGGDLGGEAVSDTLRLLAVINAQLAQIHDWGVVLKDLDRGLVDFPHMRGTEEVFLCWELDEDDIEFWHDLDDGYAGRQRL